MFYNVLSMLFKRLLGHCADVKATVSLSHDISMIIIKLMKGKALRKHYSLHEKSAASVLFKPFISSNE